MRRNLYVNILLLWLEYFGETESPWLAWRTFERPGLQKMFVSNTYIVSTVRTGEDPYGLVNQRHRENMADHMAPEDIYPQKMKLSWMLWKINKQESSDIGE